MSKERSGFSGQQAPRDLARIFSDGMSESEARRIGRKMEVDSDYQADFLQTAAVLLDLGHLRGNSEIRTALNEPVVVPLAEKARNHWPGLAVAASLILAVVFGAASLLNGNPAHREYGADVARFVTRVGEQKTINLEDGSVITLNTGSQVLVDITDVRRRVILERGEVYFDIASAPDRPFTVDLGIRAVTVLGTQFDILKTPDTFKVAVLEGLVSIHKKDEPVSKSSPLIGSKEGKDIRIESPDQNRLQAGWVAEFDLATNSVVGYRSDNMRRIHGWRTGLIRFEEEPLYKVIQELNRYSGKKILIEDKSIMDLSFYGAIRIDQLDTAVKGLEKILPVKVTHYFDRVTIVGK